MPEAQGEFILVDYDTILDNFDWSISSIPARLDKNEFEATEDGFNWEIDLDGEKVKWKQADDQKALPMVAPVVEWTAEQLAIWLDRENRDPAFSQADMLTWVSELVQCRSFWGHCWKCTHQKFFEEVQVKLIQRC